MANFLFISLVIHGIAKKIRRPLPNGSVSAIGAVVCEKKMRKPEMP